MTKLIRVLTVSTLSVIASSFFMMANAQVELERPNYLQTDQVLRSNGLRVSPRFDSRQDKGFTDFFEGRSTQLIDRDVIIDGGKEFSFRTGDSSVLMFLQGGELMSTENGEKREWEEGESWVIGPNTAVTFQTEDDSASLNWLEISTR